MNTEYVKKIQDWVVLDNQALEIKQQLKDIQEQHKELFTKRDELEKEIMDYVADNKLDSITIRTSDGNIKFSKRNSTQPLTMKLVKSLMADFCKTQPQAFNICEDIFQYISDKLDKKTKLSMVRKIDE
jgi:hypothetical protein